MQPAVEIKIIKDNHEAQRGHLLRVLGIGFGLAITIGGTIGMGILRTPGEVAAQLPQSWLFMLVWIAGGIYALLGTISVAELCTAIPRSGGFYVFARRALGEYAGFVIGWSDWLSSTGTVGAISLVIGEYTIILFPSLAGRAVQIAILVTLTLTLLQWRGIRWGSAIQNITSLIKALAFLALVAACFIIGGKSTNAAEVTTAAQSAPPVFTLTALVIALQGVIYTYDGWYGPIYFGEEVREPDRNIPRSMIGGTLSVIVIYLSINAALLYVLPISRMAGEKLAVGAAADIIFGTHGGTIIAVLAILSMLSTVNATILITTRILFAMSRDHLFTHHAARVNLGGTPDVALFSSALMAIAFVLFSGTFEKALAALAFFMVVNYTITFLAVFILRKREPHLRRPYRAWGYPFTTGLVLVGSLAFLISAIKSDTENSLRALIILAASYPLFLLVKWLAHNRRTR